MFKRYAISIEEKNLDLIRALNNNVVPRQEIRSTYFMVSIAPDGTPESRTIMLEDDLYDKNGHAEEGVTFIL